MGYIEVANLTFSLPGGRILFEDLSFRVPSGHHCALIGANGVGKTTILRLLAGKEKPRGGAVVLAGTVAYMRQFVGSFDPDATVRDVLLGVAPARIQDAARALRRSEAIVSGPHGSAAQFRYAEDLNRWGEVGGYDAEVLWDTCTTAALGLPFTAAGERRADTLSGGEQKRLALEAVFRSDADVLLLDEPDNFLDIPGKEWLEQSLNDTRKTVLFVTHDRAVLALTATLLVTLEGRSAWTHHGTFHDYGRARVERLERIEEEHRRYKEEHARIVTQIKEFKRRAAMNSKFATRARAAESKLARYERDKAPPRRPEAQDVRMALAGGRTGKIALRVEGLAFPGLVDPFDTEIWFGERVAVVGPNGAGKSHFLELLGGAPVIHTGAFRLGARVEPALFSQLHHRPDLEGRRSVLELLVDRGLELGRAHSKLKHYELGDAAGTPFELLSGGQQARLQILLLELDSPTLLLLDEPTDNLDIDSAEALELALERYEGTVVAVTHDRWFMRAFDRFLVFGADGMVRESLAPPYPLGA